MTHRRIAGKVALITGGGKGIGRETARVLGGMGARIFICGRSEDALRTTVLNLRSAGVEADYIVADVRKPEECRLAIEFTLSSAGRLDILINNAGMSMRGTLETTDPGVMLSMMEINYLGPSYMTHYAIPLIKKTHGSIVFISSLSAFHGLPYIAPYGSSKLALRGLAESLRAELKPSGVHVGIVYVGFTENDPGKVVYRQDGSLSILPKRRNSHTQSQAAKAIVQSILWRRPSTTLTAIGHVSAFVFRFFPHLSDWAISTFAARSDRYGSTEP